MSRTHTLAALLALASAAACTDEGQSMIILRNTLPGEGCAASTTGLASGVINSGASTGYVFAPVVKSVIEERDGSDRLIQLRGADIEIRDADGAVIDQHSVAFAGSVEAGGTASVAFEVVPTSVLAEVGDGAISADIQIFGTMAGGEVRTNHYTYPITICADCVLVDRGACSSFAIDYEPTLVGNLCNPAQDGEVECCSDDGGDLVCPAVGTASPDPG